MRLEKIVGPDSRSVIEKIRRSFGDEALVISNSRSENKNEIIVAIEGDGLVDLVDLVKEPLEIKQLPDKEVTDTDDQRAGVTLEILRKHLNPCRNRTDSSAYAACTVHQGTQAMWAVIAPPPFLLVRHLLSLVRVRHRLIGARTVR